MFDSNFLPANERAGVVNAIELQLSKEPEAETRNRKRLRQNPIAPWELRIKNVRVFYDVEEPSKVTILAIGKKRGNRLYIEVQEIQL